MARFSAYVLLAIWLCLTASSFVVAEVIADYANPIAATALRFWLATVLMIPLIKSQHREPSSAMEVAKYACVSSLLVGFFIGLFVALNSTTAIKTSVIYTSIPLLTVGLSVVVLSVRPSLIQASGFVLGSVGALWLLFSANRELQAQWSWVYGDAVFLLACVSLALHIVLLKHWFSTAPPVRSVFYMLLLGSLMLTPFLLVWGQLGDVKWQHPEFLWSLIYLTAFTTLGTFLLQQNILQRLSANHLLSVSYLTPMVVMLLGVSVSAVQWRGSWGAILLTLLAVALIFHRHEEQIT